MFAGMKYPDNRRGARQVRIAVLRGKETNVSEPIKIYTSTKVGRARKAALPVIDTSVGIDS